MKIGYYILIGLLLIGGFVAFTFFSVETTAPQIENTVEKDAYVEIKEQLEGKIATLNKDNVSPESYNKLRIEISGYSELIQTTRENLLESLKTTYINKSLDRAQELLSKKPEQVSPILAHLRTIKVEDKGQAKRIGEISTKIKWYYDYLKLPKELEDFFAQGSSQLTEDELNKRMKRLDIEYNEFRKNKKILDIRKKWTQEIENWQAYLERNKQDEQ